MALPVLLAAGVLTGLQPAMAKPASVSSGLLRLPINIAKCLASPGEDDGAPQDDFSFADNQDDGTTLGLSFIGLIGRDEYVEHKEFEDEKALARLAKRNRLQHTSFQWTLLPALRLETQSDVQFFRLFSYGDSLVPECSPVQPIPRQKLGREIDDPLLAGNPVTIASAVRVLAVRDDGNWANVSSLKGTLLARKWNEWRPKDWVLVSLVADMKDEPKLLDFLSGPQGSLQEAWLALSSMFPPERLGEESRGNNEALIDAGPVCALIRSVGMHNSCDQDGALDVEIALETPIRFVTGGQHSGLIYLDHLATDVQASDAADLADKASPDPDDSADAGNDDTSQDNDQQRNDASGNDRPGDQDKVVAKNDKDRPDSKREDPDASNTGDDSSSTTTADNGVEPDSTEPKNAENRDRSREDDTRVEKEQEPPAEETQEPTYQIRLEGFDDYKESNRWTVAFFPDEESCTTAVGSSEVKGHNPEERRDAEAAKGTYAVFLESDVIRSLCTEGTVNQAGDAILFPFERIELPKRKVVMVLPLSSAFAGRKGNEILKESLRQTFEELSTEKKLSAVVSVYTLSGARALELRIPPEQLPVLRQMNSEQRAIRVQGWMNQFSFEAEKLSPIQDLKYLYNPLRRLQPARIIYVVDEEDAENFESKLNLGPLFGWLLYDEIPVTIVSIKGCAGWTETFKRFDKKLECFDLSGKAANNSEKFTKLLLKAIRPAVSNQE